MKISQEFKRRITWKAGDLVLIKAAKLKKLKVKKRKLKTD